MAHSIILILVIVQGHICDRRTVIIYTLVWYNHNIKITAKNILKENPHAIWDNIVN